MRAVVIVAALLFTGCPGGMEPKDASQSAPAKTSTTTQNPQSIPGKTASMNPVTPPTKELPGGGAPTASSAVTQVQLMEYEIQMPDTLPAGRTTFQIVNSGKLNHNFAVEGNGIASKLTSDVMRGDTAQITIDLKPGTYTVYCPIDGHRGRGMQRTITVK